MKIAKIFIVFIGMIFLSSNLFTQNTPNSKYIVKPTPKFKLSQDTVQIDTIVISYKKKDTSLVLKKYRGKIPVLKSSIGGFRNNDKTSFETMKTLLDSPLTIKDSKGEIYKVLSYRFSYRKKDVYVDDQTLELKTRYDYFSFFVLENPLPIKYRKTIQEELREGEQFWFEKILVENSKQEKFISNDISLITY